jgi:hypothetical protein
LRIAETIAGSAAPAIRIRAPLANLTSIMLDDTASGTTATGANPGVQRAGPHSCCRQRNNWLEWIPAARATSDATAPGSIAAATIRRFSSEDRRRRRRNRRDHLDLGIVIGLSLEIDL